MGAITKTDIQYAQAYECPIYCFRVKRPLRHDQQAIEKYGVRALYYSHHEHLIEQIQHNMLREYDKRKEQAADAQRQAADKEQSGGLTAAGQVEEGEGEEAEEELGEEEEEEAEEDGREEWEQFIEPSQLREEQQQSEAQRV